MKTGLSQLDVRTVRKAREKIWRFDSSWCWARFIGSHTAMQLVFFTS